MTFRILTRRQVAELLTVSIDTLDRMEKAGRLPGRVQLSARRCGYREAEILKFLGTAGETGSASLPQSTAVSRPQ